MMVIAQDTAANWCTWQLLLHSTTHTFPKGKAGSDQIKTKRKKRKIISSYTKSAYCCILSVMVEVRYAGVDRAAGS